MDATHYASGVGSRNPEILIYQMCRTFGCLPSQLDSEDYRMMETMALIDLVVRAKEREALNG